MRSTFKFIITEKFSNTKKAADSKSKKKKKNVNIWNLLGGRV